MGKTSIELTKSKEVHTSEKLNTGLSN